MNSIYNLFWGIESIRPLNLEWIFLTLFNKVEKCLGIWFSCLVVHFLVLVNIVRISWHWCSSFWFKHRIFHIESGSSRINVSCIKTYKCIPIHIYERTKIFNNVLSCIYIALNLTKVTQVIECRSLMHSLIHSLMQVRKIYLRYKSMWNLYFLIILDKVSW